MDTQMLVDEAIEALESKIDDTAIIACSGGIDSTVAAVLAHRAVGSLLHCVYVDTGFMRKGETDEVREMFKEMGIELQVVDASERFFNSLDGVTDPEKKRKVIGEQFIRVFEEEQANCGAKYLVQGTIAPDWIESGEGERDVIKSHHNVGGLPDDVDMKIVEPLREFYKDEVREIARSLGIKSSERQPFPGPGLAVRSWVILLDIESRPVVRPATLWRSDYRKPLSQENAISPGNISLLCCQSRVLACMGTLGFMERL